MKLRLPILLFLFVLGGAAALIGDEAPAVPATALICALAVITWCALGDRSAVVCGELAARFGSASLHYP
jgi:hypothetical protein